MSSSVLRRLVASTAIAASLVMGACASVPADVVPAAVEVSEERPLVILVSIDGFRYDYLGRGITPNLAKLAQDGAYGPMRPSFPTITFPNHYTLVTGLHPDHHGIIGNNMIDEELGSFSLGNRNAVTNRRWWDDGEPIWVSAEKAGVRTGTMFWPGSEADVRGVRPSNWEVFDQSMPGHERVDRLLSWIDMPADKRPQLYTLYFDLVDTMGHRHGPDAPETRQALAQTDASIGHLMLGLKARGLEDKAVVIVVSDHGMAATSPDRVTYLDDFMDASAVRTVYSGPVGFFNAQPGRYDEVKAKLVGKHEKMECWEKANIPARFVLGSHKRVSDFVCLSEPNWLVGTRDRELTRPGGAHGYDNQWADMFAVFIAHGPGVVKGRVLENLDSVDVQPLLGRLLGIEVPKGDGNAEDTLPVTHP